jgi:hypothetical protein
MIKNLSRCQSLEPLAKAYFSVVFSPSSGAEIKIALICVHAQLLVLVSYVPYQTCKPAFM